MDPEEMPHKQYRLAQVYVGQKEEHERCDAVDSADDDHLDERLNHHNAYARRPETRSF